MTDSKLEQSKLEKIRRDFVANISHELRTPLTVVSGYLELLLEQKHEATQPWQRIFGQMQQQTHRMQQLVEDLLLLSSIESANLPEALIVEVNVGRMLKSICEDARSLSGEKQHIIHEDIDAKLTIKGEPKELRSAFSNLVFNAVRYTPAGGAIYVSWHEKDNHKQFTVRDTGIGIAKEHIPRLTERFYRVDKGRSRDVGGTGLGLAIVKHVLIRHHAQLDIHSELGFGSEFCCYF